MYESELFDHEDPLLGELEGDPFLGGLVGGIGHALGGILGEEEGDGLFEEEWENEVPLGEDMEAETAAALMEVLAGQVAEAESEEEADQFLPVLAALAPLAMKAAPLIAKGLPVAAKVAGKVVPHLARGMMQIGRRLARSPAARNAIRTLPTIARNTAAQVLQAHAAGQPITGQTVTRALARQTARVLRTPVRRGRCIAHSKRVSATAGRRLSSLPVATAAAR